MEHSGAVHLNSEDQCPKCYKTSSQFASVKSFKDHVNRHQLLTARCVKCNGIYKNTYSLNKHQKICGNDSNKIPCHVCLRMVRPKNYRNHVISIHEMVESYECSECFKTFKLKHRLAKHLRRVHFPTREIFKCTVCENSYVSKDSLRRHVKAKH